MSFKDYFSTQSADYAKFRPRYPDALFDFLASIAPARRVAWDCGTGNGQAAVALAERFDQVIATDPSGAQLAKAAPHERVVYREAAAEVSGIHDDTVDLVTVAQALHWFDLDAFYREVRRVAVTGGLLAVWTYDLLEITPEVDRVVGRYYHEIVGSYWPPERRMVEDGYRSIAFPFRELDVPRFAMESAWSYADMLGYMGTWSATREYVKDRGANPVEQVAGDLAEAWGDPEREIPVAWPLAVRVGVVEGD